MGKYYFTVEQVQELALNPYVLHASEKAVTYTAEFRELFVRQSQAGQLPLQIFRNCGFDPKILGHARVSSFSKRMSRYVKAGRTDLEDRRKFSSGRPRLIERTQEEEIRYLKHQLALKEQELSFLKKIDFLDRKARMKRPKGPPPSSSSL